MIAQITYLAVLFLELIFFAGIAIYTVFLIYSSIKGAPFVPTKNKEIDLILKQAQLKKNQTFLDLGCGDGRMVRRAVKQYYVNGIGIDVNFILLTWAKLLAKIQKLSAIEFRLTDMTTNHLPLTDVIYIFLFPKLIEKITPQLKDKLDKGSLIISHGFKITKFNSFLKKKIDHHPFPTYYYKL